MRRAATTDKKAAKNWGNLVLAVDPELMGDKAEFAVSAALRRKLERVSRVALSFSSEERGGRVRHSSCFFACLQYSGCNWFEL